MDWQNLDFFFFLRGWGDPETRTRDPLELAICVTNVATGLRCHVASVISRVLDWTSKGTVT